MLTILRFRDIAVSVSVAVWTLVAISLERYFAICRPLKSRRWQTSNHASKMIACVWLASLGWSSPILLVSTLQVSKKGPLSGSGKPLQCSAVQDRVPECSCAILPALEIPETPSSSATTQRQKMSSRERSPSGSESDDSNHSKSDQGKPARRPAQKPSTLLSFKAKTKAADLQSLRLANSKFQESVTTLKKQNQLLAQKLAEQDHKISLLLSAVAEAHKQILPKAPSSHPAEKMEVDDFPPLKAKPRLNIPKTSNPALHEHMPLRLPQRQPLLQHPGPQALPPLRHPNPLSLHNQMALPEIQAELEELGFTPSEIQFYRMGNRKTTTNMVKMLLPREQTSIFEVKYLLSLPVVIEPQRHPQTNIRHIPQCKRCQKFGHRMANCMAKPFCHKCTQQHFYSECKKPRDIPAKCINCDGPHPASLLLPQKPKLPCPKARKSQYSQLPDQSFAWYFLRRQSFRSPGSSPPSQTPPFKLSKNVDYTNFLNRNIPTLLAGDLNSKKTSWGCRKTNAEGRKLLKFEIHALSESTHYDHNTPDILDIAISKDIYHILHVTNSDSLSSDHKHLSLAYHLGEAQISVHPPQNLQDLNNLTAQITETITSALSETTILKPNSNNNLFSPPPELKTLIKNRNRLKRRAKQFTDSELNKQANKLSKENKIQISNLRNERWTELLENLTTRDPRAWKISKAMRGKQKRTFPLYIVSEGWSIWTKKKLKLLRTL
ncbi:hypothetical protein D910_05551 [Dendroctonus ponderosae]|uniref:G-protein coupled receptors family 1 profile domain-containing protein n=1 Tax=Dendroctonus ponderosae TaxID=77166 RepID=U4U738_DENPD|nr:hypothetical protein D910_05551 [Dendroctonus ponderosae]